MELEHFSHQHPLRFGELKEGDQFICSGCEEQIWGPTYGCAACKFILHKRCAELPWEIKSHLHSEHSLVLLAQPPSHYTRCVCDLCKKICRSFVYHCSYCQFDLDIHCVFPARTFERYLSHREMELKHFSHPHPLIFSDIRERGVCNACEEDVVGPKYSCRRCNFILHTKCAELPWEMICHLHPPHPLKLLTRPPPHYAGKCVCDLCRRTCKSFVYHCEMCNFDADVKCAFPWIFESNSSSRVVKFEHFSHPHTLILNQEQKADDGVICFGCEERVSGPTYSCNSCNFNLHKKCAELPQEIQSHFHPEHPLVLLAKPAPNYRGSYVCDLCCKTHRSFVYHCSFCSFDLDIKCAFPPCISEAEKQEHQFIGLLKSVPLKSFSFICNACGTDGDEDPCLCAKCQLMLHRKCTTLPQTIKIAIHQHPISRTYFLRKIEDGSSTCRICQSKLKADYGGYFCQECNFVAHVNCILDTFRSRVHNAMPSVARKADPLQATTSRISEIRLGEDKGISEIKHFSHQHPLILFNEANNDKHCDGCMFPISTPYYGCTECDFFLDKACIELPNQKLFLNGGLPLTLRSKEPTFDGVFRCSACHQYSNGFVYKSNEIDVSFDVRCSNLISNTFKHEGHQHPLCFAPKCDRHCDACGENGWPFLFKCVDCNFNLDFRCASLPNKVRHKYDRHPLVLAYNSAVEDSDAYCDICQCERNPKLWFYNCAECSFAAHPNCILGKNHQVKLGGSYAYDIHPHPLTLVQKKGKFPPCHSCCRPCNDLALECTVSQCNFIVHRKKDYCLSRNHNKKHG